MDNKSLPWEPTGTTHVDIWESADTPTLGVFNEDGDTFLFLKLNPGQEQIDLYLYVHYDDSEPEVFENIEAMWTWVLNYIKTQQYGFVVAFGRDYEQCFDLEVSNKSLQVICDSISGDRW